MIVILRYYPVIGNRCPVFMAYTCYEIMFTKNLIAYFDKVSLFIISNRYEYGTIIR